MTEKKNKPISIVLVDDHLLFRQSIKVLLSDMPDFVVVGESGDGRESLLMIEKLQPSVVILDITMSGLGGLELAPGIKKIAPKAKTIMLTMHENPEYVYRAFKVGCQGYVLKSDSADDLAKAIKVVAKGETYLSPGITSDFISHLISKADAGDTSPSLLTPREQEVCSLVAQGRSTEQISADLFISPKTVRVHVANIMAKLSCKTRTELVLRLQEREKEGK